MVRSIVKFLGKVLSVMIAFGCIAGCAIILGSMFGIPTLAAMWIIGGLWYALEKKK
jgi:hypothetical protein